MLGRKSDPLSASASVALAQDETLDTLQRKLDDARRDGVPGDAKVMAYGMYSTGTISMHWLVRDTRAKAG